MCVGDRCFSYLFLPVMFVCITAALVIIGGYVVTAVLAFSFKDDDDSVADVLSEDVFNLFDWQHWAIGAALAVLFWGVIGGIAIVSCLLCESSTWCCRMCVGRCCPGCNPSYQPPATYDQHTGDVHHHHYYASDTDVVGSTITTIAAAPQKGFEGGGGRVVGDDIIYEV